MRQIILIFILLSTARMGCAQYIYWNHVMAYPSDTVNCLIGYLEQTNDGFLSLGAFSSTSAIGVTRNKLDINGDIVEFAYTAVPINSYAGASGYSSTSYTHLNNGYYLHTRSNYDNASSIPYYVMLDPSMDTVWTWYFDEYPEPNESNGGVYGSAAINYNEFLNVCVASNNDGLRFVHANTNHEILSDVIWYPQLAQGNTAPAPDFVMQGTGDTLLICGEVQHISGIDEDFQVYLLKSDFLATDVQMLELGNADNCYDLAPGIVNMPNGHVLMLYSRCIEQTWFNQATVAFHAVEINTDNMEIVNDEVLDLGAIDDGVIGQLDVYRLIKNPFGGYLAFVQYVGAGGIGRINYLLKINENLQVEWINSYYSLLDGDYETIIDVISTSDGGYAATGTSQGQFLRQWVFKLDACGYVIPPPTPCPATVEIEKLNDSKIESLSVWPNPFYGQLKAVLPLNAKRIFITDAIGRVVYQENVYYPNQEFNLSFLEDGIYMMNVETEDSKGAGGRTIGQKVVKR